MTIRLLFKRAATCSLPFSFSSFCSKVPRRIVTVEESSKPPAIQRRFSPLLPPSRGHSEDFKIELVDDGSWQVSSGLTEAWRQMHGPKEKKSSMVEPIDESESLYSPEFDDIEDMRFQGTLFYKLDRDSREFEECNFDFKGKKSLKKLKDEPKEKIKKERMTASKDRQPLKLAKPMKNKALLEEGDSSCVDKKLRTPTFNQLTGPYHEPFCLDIYLSNSSVRACIVHRVTSKVVVVAHSISKDMKFDLKSTKDANACAAVGQILAQRALADDIHDIVYTPRKGDKVEGKLEIVLQSLIDHGINVKVKIKQRKAKRVDLSSK